MSRTALFANNIKQKDFSGECPVANLRQFVARHRRLLSALVKKLQLVALAILITHPAFAQKPTLLRTVVIDAGHGGKDPGCLGAHHKEKDIALSVALKLGKYIESHMKDVKVIFTRTEDVFVDLEDRAQIANKAKADLFISIHCNAAGKAIMITDPKTGKKRPKTFRNRKGKLVVAETTNPVPFGSETYVMGLKNEEGKMKVATRENSVIYLEDEYEKKYGGFDPESEESYIIMSNYTSAYVIQSANLALKIQEEYTNKAGRVDKGVHRQSIWVLWRTSMPSVLTELGYLTNPLEETFLGSEKGQDHLAMAMFRGLRKYRDELAGVKKEYDDFFENVVALENENLRAGKELKAAEADADSEMVALEMKVTQPTPIGSKTSIGLPPRDEKDQDALPDSLPRAVDTIVAATNIAEAYKAQAAANPPVAVKADAVVFKVQIASSEAGFNVSKSKFAQVSDVDFYKENNALKYTSGQFNRLSDAIAHKNTLRENGFADCFVVALKNGKRIGIEEAKKLAEE